MNTKFAFDNFPVLHTERFTLRAARELDCHDLLALYSDERVAQFLPLEPFKSVDDAKEEMGWYKKIFAEQSGLRWMIEDTESGRVIGTCGFLNREDVHNRAEIGYDLHPDYWGRGVMTEVARSVIHFGFVNMQLNKIEAKADPQNEGSIALLKKLGFEQEGLLREHEFEKGRYIDLAVFSVLNKEPLARESAPWIPLDQLNDDEKIWAGTKIRQYSVGLNVTDKNDDYYDYLVSYIFGNEAYLQLTNLSRGEAGNVLCVLQKDSPNHYSLAGKLKEMVGLELTYVQF